MGLGGTKVSPPVGEHLSPRDSRSRALLVHLKRFVLQIVHILLKRFVLQIVHILLTRSYSSYPYKVVHYTFLTRLYTTHSF